MTILFKNAIELEQNQEHRIFEVDFCIVLFSFEPKPNHLVLIKTRTELPSCETKDIKKVNFGNIVRPHAKPKAGPNLMLLPTTNLNFLKASSASLCVAISKLLPTSKIEP